MALNSQIARRPVRGMIVRSEEVLEPGVSLFKLGNRFVKGRRLSDIEMASSPWWLSEGSVEVILKSAQAGDARLSEAFRRFGAVAKRWGGSADHIVKAIIAGPVISYIGPGTVQDFRDIEGESKTNEWDMPLWCPPPNIPQIYIPVALKTGVSIARAAFRKVYIVPIDKWRDEFVRKDPDDKWLLL